MAKTKKSGRAGAGLAPRAQDRETDNTKQTTGEKGTGNMKKKETETKETNGAAREFAPTAGTGVARLMGGVTVVRDPFAPDVWHRASNVDALIASARGRLNDRRAQFEALGDLAAAPLEAVRDMRKAVEADDKALRDFDGGLRDALLDLSGFKAFAVQSKGTGARIDPLSVRGGFAEMVKALKAVEDAARPPAPTHTYFYAVTATDAEHAALQRAIKKADPGYMMVSPQLDADWKKAAKLFGIGK